MRGCCQSGYNIDITGHVPKIDSNAVPYLVKALHRHPSPLQRWYSALRTKLAVRSSWWSAHWPANPGPNEENVVLMLRQLNPPPPEAVDAIISEATNKNSRAHALAMESLGYGGVPRYLETLLQIAQTDTNEWADAVSLMEGSWYTPNTGVTQYFLRLRDGTNQNAKSLAIEVLEDHDLFLAMEAASERKSKLERLSAMDEMLQIGTSKLEFEPYVFTNLIGVAIQNTNDVKLRLAAIETMAALGGTNPLVNDTIRKLEEDREPSVTAEARRFRRRGE